MARIGLKTTLIHQLETSKTYHSPINLRFTWPIELTKTCHTGANRVQLYILNSLGSADHGWRYIIVVENRNIIRMDVSLFRRNVCIYTYGHQRPNIAGISQIIITDADVLVPAPIHVRVFAVSSFEISSTVVARMVRRREAYFRSANRLEVLVRGVIQKVICLENMKYEQVLEQLVRYT